MEEEGMDKSMIGRVKRMYENTEVTINTKNGLPKGFDTRKSLKQGCVMSPLLFNIYMADLDSRFKKRDIGGIRLGKDMVTHISR